MPLLRKPPKNWVIAGLCLVSLILMFLPEDLARWPGQRLRRLLALPGGLGMRFPLHVRQRVHELTGRGGSGEDAAVAALRQQVLNQQQVIADLRQEINQLRKWRSVLKGFPCMLIPARVVGGEGVPMQDRMLISLPSRQAVREGDVATTRVLLHEMPVAVPDELAVLGNSYVVGKVLSPAGYTATLQLLTDRRFRMPGKVFRMISPGQQRTIYVSVPGGGLERRTIRHDGKTPAPHPATQEGIDVFAQGDGRQVVLKDVPAHHGIQPGDLLTSSNSQLLPLGLTVGRVVGSQRQSDSPDYVTVFVEPLADLQALRKVFIVVPYGREGG